MQKFKQKSNTAEDNSGFSKQINDILVGLSADARARVLGEPFPEGHKAQGLVLLHGVLENRGVVPIDIIKYIMEESPESVVHAPNKKGYTPLHYAVKNNDVWSAKVFALDTNLIQLLSLRAADP